MGSIDTYRYSSITVPKVSILLITGTKHSLYTFHISREFRVSLMPQKNKLRNPMIFFANASHSAKCEKQKKECETQKK